MLHVVSLISDKRWRKALAGPLLIAVFSMPAPLACLLGFNKLCRLPGNKNAQPEFQSDSVVLQHAGKEFEENDILFCKNRIFQNIFINCSISSVVYNKS
ncbi:MAG: hypothetical protein Q8R69_17785 [Telluria sp.]|nr:hypothetical protein [Telluria sp.]